MFTIVPADLNRYNEIMELYRVCTKALSAIGVIQWDEEYPSGLTLQENLRCSSTFIVHMGSRIVGTITLDTDQDIQYQNIQWALMSDTILVVHRLCVHPEFQGNGLAKMMMAFAEDYAIEHQKAVIRLDAYLGNGASQKLYRSLGYQEAIGYCYYPPVHIMCNCFEKRLLP